MSISLAFSQGLICERISFSETLSWRTLLKSLDRRMMARMVSR